MVKKSEPKTLPRLAWLVTVMAFGFLVFKGATASGYQWEWHQIPAFFFDWETLKPGPLWFGLVVTFEIIIWSLGLTFALGLLVAFVRLVGGPVLGRVAHIYLEIVRNTPLLIQLFVIYFILGPVFDLSAFGAAIIALSLFEGAYLSEIFRSGILAVHKGQWQASWCLGLSTPATFRRVILPQAGPMLLPPIASLVISLVKDSALASTIAVYELTKAGRTLASETFLAFEIWLVVALVYLVINLSMSQIGTMLEHRLNPSKS